jgi:hypothetical protein
MDKISYNKIKYCSQFIAAFLSKGPNNVKQITEIKNSGIQFHYSDITLDSYKNVHLLLGNRLFEKEGRKG